MRKMKDSGVEWIGEIPEEWEINKIHTIYSERNSKVSDSDFPPLSVTKQGVVPQLETAAKTDNGDNRKLIKKNDFVINSRSDRRGSCGISEYDGSCSVINIVLKPRKNMFNLFYNFVFHTELFADEFYCHGNGIVDDLWSTKWSNMKNIIIPVPSINDQRHIAEYLDSKCSKIDGLVSDIEKQITTLEQYKRSVITEAVTKGLDPTVPMKDSGIEWIGEIPEKWAVQKVKLNFSIISGNGFKEQYQGKEQGDYPFCKASDINGNEKIISSAANYVDNNIVKIEGYNVIPPYSIIMAKIGEALKKNHRKINAVPCIIDNNCQALAQIKNNNLGYLYYLLTQIDMSWFDNSGTVPCVNNTAFKNSYICLPPLPEQQQIADYLNVECSEIDNTISLKKQQIETLNDYKKSLIYEYVTGKKEIPA